VNAFTLAISTAALLAVSAGVVVVVPTMPTLASAASASTMSNWSGYSLTGSDFTGVTGTFNVPAPVQSGSCLEDSAVWVGVDGLHNHDLLQAGIAEIGVAQSTPSNSPSDGLPGLICLGPVQLYAWWEDLPSAAQRVDMPVRVGDSVTVSIFKMSPGWWAVAVHDLTARQSFMLVQPYAGPQTSVEWVVEAPQVLGVLRVPVPFGAVRFRDLGAQGRVRRLERFSSGSSTFFGFRPDVVASTAQLIQSGFAVHAL
jgi:Peptidase A4 family